MNKFGMVVVLSLIAAIGIVFSAEQEPPLKIKFGDSLAAITSAYGEPPGNYFLPNFNPRVIRRVMYSEKGLTFMLSRDRVYNIIIGCKFRGVVACGIKIGEPLARAIAVYGKDYKTSTGHDEFYSRFASCHDRDTRPHQDRDVG